VGVCCGMKITKFRETPSVGCEIIGGNTRTDTVRDARRAISLFFFIK